MDTTFSFSHTFIRFSLFTVWITPSSVCTWIDTPHKSIFSGIALTHFRASAFNSPKSCPTSSSGSSFPQPASQTRYLTLRSGRSWPLKGSCRSDSFRCLHPFVHILRQHDKGKPHRRRWWHGLCDVLHQGFSYFQRASFLNARIRFPSPEGSSCRRNRCGCHTSIYAPCRSEHRDRNLHQ